MSNSAFEDIMERLQNPDNNLTPEERQKIRNLSGNVENSLKASLINLLMGQFTKISAYDRAAQRAIILLSARAEHMASEDLIAFLTALTKVSASESKSVMDLFKKSDTDLKQFLREIQKLTNQRPAYRDDNDDVLEYSDDEATLKKMNPEKKEKLLKLLDKMNEVEDVEIVKDKGKEPTTEIIPDERP